MQGSYTRELWLLGTIWTFYLSKWWQECDPRVRQSWVQLLSLVFPVCQQYWFFSWYLTYQMKRVILRCNLVEVWGSLCNHPAQGVPLSKDSMIRRRDTALGQREGGVDKQWCWYVTSLIVVEKFLKAFGILNYLQIHVKNWEFFPRNNNWAVSYLCFQFISA